MNRTKTFRILAAATLLGGAVYLSFATAEPNPEVPDPTVHRVEVAPARIWTEGGTLRFAGVTRAAHRAELGFTLPGRMAVRPVEVGDRVAAHQVLARLDAEEPTNAVDAAAAALAEIEARLAQATRERERAERLFRAKAATAEEREQLSAAAAALEAARESAVVRLREARRQLTETTLAAPYAGTVTAVLAEPGEYLSPGRPVVVVSGDGDLEVEIGVPESVVPGLAAGDAARVSLPLAGNAEAEGRIRSLGRAAMGSGHLFPVVVGLEAAAGLAPGMTAEVRLRLAAPSAAEGEPLAVPLAAVLNPGGSGAAVFIVRDEHAERVPVAIDRIDGELALLRGGRPDIRSGAAVALAAGDEVVVAGQIGLAHGDRVEVGR